MELEKKAEREDRTKRAGWKMDVRHRPDTEDCFFSGSDVECIGLLTLISFVPPTTTGSRVLVPLHHMVVGQRDSPALVSWHHDTTGLRVQLQHSATDMTFSR